MPDVDRDALPAVVAAVRERAPLVHCITATVSMGLVADGLLAAGARPMMTETEAEAPAMTVLADALLVNLGTLSTDGAQGIPLTVARTVAAGHPWLLDPAAVGAGPVRARLARDLLAHRPTAIRGNASEILALGGQGSGGRGADATDTPAQARAAGAELASRSGTIVAISGPVDLITDGGRDVRVHGGTALLTRVTGAGCLLGALTAACVAVADPWHGVVAAAAWLALAGENAAGIASRPGSFRVALIDALDALDPADIAARVELT